MSTCGLCNEPLPADAVSDYFCTQDHQDLWHKDRSVPLASDSIYKKYLEHSRRRAAEESTAWTNATLSALTSTMDQIRVAMADAGSACEQGSTQFDDLTSVARSGTLGDVK